MERVEGEVEVAIRSFRRAMAALAWAGMTITECQMELVVGIVVIVVELTVCLGRAGRGQG